MPPHLVQYRRLLARSPDRIARVFWRPYAEFVTVKSGGLLE